MELTEKLGLRKPSQEDFYDIDDHNHNSDLIDQAIKDLQDSNATKADDTAVVHKTGDETIQGAKTFKSPIIADGVKGENGSATVYSSATDTTISGGAKLTLKDATNGGGFTLSAGTAEGSRTLSGGADGSLKWGNKDLTVDCLPLTGGTMTGNLDMGGFTVDRVVSMEMTGNGHGGYIDFHYDGSEQDCTSRIIENAEGQISIGAPAGVEFTSPTIRRNTTDSELILHGGTTTINGGGLWLDGGTHPDFAGWFRLRTATSASDAKDLIGKPNGELSWSGNLRVNDEVAVVSQNLIGYLFNQDNGNYKYTFVACKDANSNEGSSLILCPPGSQDDGSFIVRAKNLSGNTDLWGKPGGGLTWGNKEVERVNSSGGDWIRYESGLQICWGGFGDATTLSTVVFPVPFSVTPNIQISVYGQAPNAQVNYSDLTTTGAKIYAQDTKTWGNWLAIGKWK